MSFLRGPGSAGRDDSALNARVAPLHEERRAARSTRLGAGTLACADCDAPIAIGAWAHSLADELTCPYCQNRAPLRDFLSLASPTRPQRVVVRVIRPAMQTREEMR